MTKAFVFGKFLPFHKGHEALIRFALSHCDFLSVLICCSDKETISAHTRKLWIEHTFSNTSGLEVKIFNYSENELPNTSVTSHEVSQKWSEAFRKIYPDFSLVITSESYGSIVAEMMGIRHLEFDRSRKRFPVSASDIKANIISNWNFLPSPVKASYAIKVVILGTESTGKTVLTEKLASHYYCSKVSEAGRDLIPSSNTFTFNDLEKVATAHAERIEHVMHGNSALIIIDTDIHITKSYALFTFSKKLEVSDEVYQANEAHLYLYLKNDVPHIQDGTRLSESDRNKLDLFHRQVLSDHQIVMQEIFGDWDERFEQAVKHIDNLLALLVSK